MPEELVNIPYFVHEGEMTRLERANKRWFIAFMVVLAMMFLTNAGWIVYEKKIWRFSIMPKARGISPRISKS